MTARRVLPAVLAAACCLVVAGCKSPGYLYVPSPPPKPVYAEMKAVPDSYLGVYNSSVPRSYSAVDRFAKAVGRQPNIVMYFSGWGTAFKQAFAATALRHGAVPFVEMQPTGISMASIAGGQQDAYLRSFANSVREFGHPVLIGFAHEMNGSWYTWGWKHTSPQVWVSAWRHVVTVFRQQGADNVSWLWVINGLAPSEGPIADWWPGAGYVTWVGVDAYYEQQAQTFSTLFGPTLAAVRKFTTKPVLITETGVGPVAGQAAKLPGLFAGIRARHLLGAVYYDKAQSHGVHHQNWRIDKHPDAIAAFRSSIRRYLR